MIVTKVSITYTECGVLHIRYTLAEKSIGPLGFFVIGLFVSLKKAACAPYVAEQSSFYLSIMFKSLSCQYQRKHYDFTILGPFFRAKQFKTAKTIVQLVAGWPAALLYDLHASVWHRGNQILKPL